MSGIYRIEYRVANARLKIHRMETWAPSVADAVDWAEKVLRKSRKRRGGSEAIVTGVWLTKSVAYEPRGS